MEPFSLLFPSMPLWVISVGNGMILPEGYYAFLEFYCGNPTCDCKSGKFDMVEVNLQGEVLGNCIAEICYAWDTPFTKDNPYLPDYTSQSKLALAALQQFTKSLQNDIGQLEKIKSNYKMLKEYFVQNPHQIPTNFEKQYKVGRNDPCPCGSGKKYKKCCINL